MLQSFRISTALKDLIGRGLITNDSVAVFELVKNSFDAHATSIQIVFASDSVIIKDNGKGMSKSDMLDKWLFVAYSAKRDDTEDDYRDAIVERKRPYAGAKGVGRFSCDRLGKKLMLSSRSRKQQVQTLEVDWTKYEKDAKQEFGEVTVNLTEAENFSECAPDGGTGTVLKINRLRSSWDRDKLGKLKRELMKLINPFADEPTRFQIEIIAPGQQEKDAEDRNYNSNLSENKEPRLIINGKIENPVLQVLKNRTTAIKVEVIDGGSHIETTLEDRGDLIYRIREENEYPGLKDSKFLADICFLNRSAKAVFARRMGIPSVRFGSIFLFRNGFRVFPIGNENDDFFGLARRQQQGMRRFLGSRDLIGRVEVAGTEGFDEATSRDQGLIRTAAVENLTDCVLNKCIRRLERYIVDITWRDKFDKDMSNTSRMQLDESSARITRLVSRLADTNGVDLIEYNPDLVRIIDDKSEEFNSSLSALALLAEKTGNKELRDRVDHAKARMKELEIAKADALAAERRAESRAKTAELKYGEEKQRNEFLIAAASLDHDTILNLHHQILMLASDVHLGIRRMMGKLRKGLSVDANEWIGFLGQISFRNSQIMTASRFATKGGYKQQSTEIRADLAVYMRDYITTISSLWAPRGIAVEAHEAKKAFDRPFRPIEVGIVIDNLVSNASKAKAERIEFFFDVSKGHKPELSITVADNGNGWPPSLEPVERVFEKGVTTTDGSGLGLFHVKEVVERMGGLVEVSREPHSSILSGACVTLRIPA